MAKKKKKTSPKRRSKPKAKTKKKKTSSKRISKPKAKAKKKKKTSSKRRPKSKAKARRNPSAQEARMHEEHGPGYFGRLWDALWGRAPEEAPHLPAKMPQVIALVYELFEGYDTDPSTGKREPMSRFLIYLTQAMGATPAEAATAMKWQLQSQWDQRRADDFGMVSLTIVWFDPAKREYSYDLVYGQAPPQDILTRLIGMVGEPPPAGAAPEAGPSIRVRRPAPVPRGTPSVSEGFPEVSIKPAGSPAQGPAGWPGMPGIGGMPGMSGMPGMGAAPKPAGRPKAGPSPTPTPVTVMPTGMPDPSWVEAELRKLSRNPALQMEVWGNPDYHVTGKFGRLGDVDFTVEEQLRGARPSAVPVEAKPKSPPKPVALPGPKLPPRVELPTPPGDLVEQTRQFEEDMRSWHTKEMGKLRGRAANPRKKKPKKKRKKKATKKKATHRKATKKKARKKRSGSIVGGRKTKKPKKAVKKTKSGVRTSWKVKMDTVANLEPSSSRKALIGYLIGRKLTSPRYLKSITRKKGRMMGRLDTHKTHSTDLGSIKGIEAWWKRTMSKAKLNAIEIAQARKHFAQKTK